MAIVEKKNLQIIAQKTYRTKFKHGNGTKVNEKTPLLG